MGKNGAKPNISRRVFWDVNFDSLDYDKDRLFIIEKVMNYGLWDDFVALMKYYGKDIVRQEIVKSSCLKKDVLNFLCFYLDLKPSQSNATHADNHKSHTGSIDPSDVHAGTGAVCLGWLD